MKDSETIIAELMVALSNRRSMILKVSDSFASGTIKAACKCRLLAPRVISR